MDKAFVLPINSYALKQARNALNLDIYGKREIKSGITAEFIPLRQPKWRNANPTIYDCTRIEFEVEVFQDFGNFFLLQFQLFAINESTLPKMYEYFVVCSNSTYDIGIFANTIDEVIKFISQFKGDSKVLRDFEPTEYGFKNLEVCL